MGIAVFDLDSTIADTSPRHHLSPFVNPEETWHSYAKACANDKPMWGTIEMIRTYSVLHKIHIVTGRRSTAREETISWLDRYKVPWNCLRMREETDLYSNTDFKIDYMRSIQDGPIVLFVSDWSPECQAVRNLLGVPSLCVNPEYSTKNGSDPTMGEQWDNPVSKGTNRLIYDR